MNTDICAVTETWIKQDGIDAKTREIPPKGYKYYLNPKVEVELKGA